MTLLGEFLYNMLLEAGDKGISPYDAYKEFKKALKEGLETRIPSRVVRRPSRVSYQTVLNYFFWYRKLGLIEKAREETPLRPWLLPKKNYYRMVEGAEAKLEQFLDPRTFLYPETHPFRKH